MSAAVRKAGGGGGLHLFRVLMQTTRVLPESVRDYYRGHIASNFRQHMTENDEEVPGTPAARPLHSPSDCVRDLPSLCAVLCADAYAVEE
jgi:hypothetical protein